MWRNLLIQALYQVTVLLVLNFRGTYILNLNNDERGNAVKNTLIFNGFVLCQIFNEFNARKPEEINVFSGVTKNHIFMGIVGTTFVLQVMIIQFLGKFTSTVRLGWKLWVVYCYWNIQLASCCCGKAHPGSTDSLGQGLQQTISTLHCFS